MERGTKIPMLKTFTVNKLRIELKNRGLSVTGNKTELYNRYRKSVRQEAVAVATSDSLEKPNDEWCDALVHAPIPFDDPDSMVDIASSTLRGEAAPDKLTVESSLDGIIVGNRRGLNIFERLSELQAKIYSQDSKISAQDSKISDLESMLQGLSEENARFKSSLDHYAMHRRRFLLTFKRDFLGGVTAKEQQAIGAANDLVHGGDMVFDLRFCLEIGGGIEEETYTELYGLSPLKARTLHDARLIAAINRYVTVKTSNRKQGNANLDGKFLATIAAIKHAMQDHGSAELSPATSPFSALDMAYHKLLESLKVDVTLV